MDELSGPERRLGLHEDPMTGFGWMVVAGVIYLLAKHLPKQRGPILVLFGPLAAGPLTFFPGGFALMYLYPWLDMISRLSFLHLPRLKEVISQHGLFTCMYIIGYISIMIMIFIGFMNKDEKSHTKSINENEKIWIAQVSLALVSPIITYLYVTYFD
jgi:hypothetical protein